MSDAHRIVAIALDDASIIRRTPEVEHERAIAMADLLEGNHFAPKTVGDGPYDVFISVKENRLTFHIACPGEQAGAASSHKIVLPLQPFRGIIRDYFMICESYFDAIKHASPSKIETIDMARRGIHNEGSGILTALLEDKIGLDSETSRRLFTLICVLHIK